MVDTIIQKSWDSLQSFLETSENIALFYDDDPDGISSGVQLKRLFEKLGKNVPLLLHFNEKKKPFSEDFINLLKKHNVDTLVTTDYNIAGFGLYDAYKKCVETNDLKVAIIDHHNDSADYDNEKTLELNISKLQNTLVGGQYCCAKYVNDIVRAYDTALADSLAWIATIGIIGDSNAITWKTFVNNTIEKTNSLYVDEKEMLSINDVDDVYLTPFGMCSNYMFFGIAKGSEEVQRIFDIVDKSPSIFELAKQLKQYEPIKEEVYDYVENYDYFIKNMGGALGESNIFELEIKSENKIVSIVANLLGYKDKDTIFLVYQKVGDVIFTSIRGGDNAINLGAILNICCQDIPGANGGGHKAAAGAKVPVDSFNTFKDTFYAYFESKDADKNTKGDEQ
ncbi:MAG: DHHA1 domain-containing protein [Candidatus Woesearchaeota archaeon]